MAQGNVLARLNGEDDRGIMIGMALAAAILVRDFDQPTLARELLNAAGLTTGDELSMLDLDDYDAKALQRIVP